MGDRVRFWTDQWCGDLHLHLSFPVVYGIAINREASVASSLERMGTEARRSWKVPLLRNPNDWESGDVDDFLHTLGDNLPPSEQRDRMIWKLSKKGEFDVRSFYDKFRCPLPIIFPWKGVWKVKAPVYVSFFVWSAAWEKILTGDILRCRGFDFVDWCILCRSNGGRRITCFFTVEKLLSCGAWFSDLLGFLGSCLDRLQTRFAAGGTGSESTLLGFGI